MAEETIKRGEPQELSGGARKHHVVVILDRPHGLRPLQQPVQLSFFPGAALARNEVFREGVIRPLALDTPFDRHVEGVSPLDVDVLNRAGGVGHSGLQQVAVIHRELVGAVGAPDQISNDVVSLGRNVAAEEVADSAGARNAPGEVQSYAPQELRVICERGMRNAGLLHLAENKIVNVVSMRDIAGEAAALSGRPGG